MRPLYLPLAVFLAISLSGCDETDPRFLKAEPGEALSGGDATVRQQDHNAFSLPSANLPPLRRLDFSVGNSFFRNPWVIAPATTTARDGIGPLMNTNACQNCHIKDGRGHPPGPDAASSVSMLVRVSIPADEQHQALLERLGNIPEPVYGGQLQDMANPGVEPEVRIRVDYRPVEVELDDGTQITLRDPELKLDQLAYGPLHPQAQLSARVAPPMIGLGLLEAIPEAAILANADPEDQDGDGISGRANRVWNTRTQSTDLGRFGWKAGLPTLEQQNAQAFASDMGLTSMLATLDDCTEAQLACRSAAHGGTPEVSDKLLDAVTFYTRNLGVPARRNVDDAEVLRGKSLFHQAGCAKCHVPTFTTAAEGVEPELANQTIRPYTDLLLHDMGEGLADHRPEFIANGREWRTPPLWGIGLTEAVSGHTQFLHDGRARNLLEAILWHGGEAEQAREAVMAFDRDERAALLAFLESL
ncbi:di-heme oxidoredictase family protein [Stutzerimonas urumqiensis]|uniref:di-heme oxidoreductase family protein n=1 Tax=Stutzerimonas urumqiensis TaxID=638269 RepID=UPI000EB57872|nr:di-heme oxidoredictase family protein [Stutzerimonas urumqiensis]